MNKCLLKIWQMNEQGTDNHVTDRFKYETNMK